MIKPETLSTTGFVFSIKAVEMKVIEKKERKVLRKVCGPLGREEVRH